MGNATSTKCTVATNDPDICIKRTPHSLGDAAHISAIMQRWFKNDASSGTGHDSKKMLTTNMMPVQCVSSTMQFPFFFRKKKIVFKHPKVAAVRNEPRKQPNRHNLKSRSLKNPMFLDPVRPHIFRKYCAVLLSPAAPVRNVAPQTNLQAAIQTKTRLVPPKRTAKSPSTYCTCGQK